MKVFSVEEAKRKINEILDDVERRQEEIVIVRDRKTVARLVPELPPQNAVEILSDLEGALDEVTADALATAIRISRKGKGKNISKVRNPWRS
jgi:antitoxin (DNA-binding transcriptional repressor) of toxin-antitoxin stability system